MPSSKTKVVDSNRPLCLFDRNSATNSNFYFFFWKNHNPKMHQMWASIRWLSHDICAEHTVPRWESNTWILTTRREQHFQLYHESNILTTLYKFYLICALCIHFTLVNFTTVQMNEIEPRRSNPAVFPQIRNICYVVWAISIMEIATTS